MTWNLTVNVGFNKILFNTSYDVTKGSLLYLDQSLDRGKIALDTLGNATFSDMKFGFNLINYYEETIIGNLTNISGIKYVNYRFYINALTTLEYYKNSFSFVHLYDSALLYNLTVAPVGSTFVFPRKVLIDRKYLKNFLNKDLNDLNNIN